MSVTRLTCPACATTLKLATAVAPGKKVKCPKCANVFAVPAADADTEVQPPKPSAPPAKTAPRLADGVRAKAPAPPADDDDFENLAPPRRPGKPAAPVDDDADEAPDDEAPPPKKGKGKKKASPLMFWGVVGGGIAAVGIGFLALLFFMKVGPFAQEIGGITRKQPPPDTTPYAVKAKRYPDVGKIVKVTQTIDAVTVNKEYDAAGEVKQEKTEKRTQEQEYALEILEMEGSHPKKFKRTYKKAVTKIGDKEIPSPYQGRTILFELADSKYTATAEGDPPLAPPQLADVLADANKVLEGDMEKILLPKGAVKIDEKWDLDAKALVAMFDKKQFDASASSGKAQLDRVEEKDGKKVAIIDADIKLAHRKTGQAEPAVTELKLTLTTVMDGSSPIWTFTAKMDTNDTSTRKDGSKSENIRTLNMSIDQALAGQ